MFKNIYTVDYCNGRTLIHCQC